MTICSTFANSIKKRIEEGKTLDEISEELCTDVKFNRAKVIRIIKDFLGEMYLIRHAETLKYDVVKAQLARKKKSHKKIDAPEHDESDGVRRYHLVEPLPPELLDAVRNLLQRFSLDDIGRAFTILVPESPNDETSINNGNQSTDLKDEITKT